MHWNVMTEAGSLNRGTAIQLSTQRVPSKRTYARLTPEPKWRSSQNGAIRLRGAEPEGRPVLAVLHEHFHQYGFYHAGLLCGADLAINWAMPEVSCGL